MLYGDRDAVSWQVGCKDVLLPAYYTLSLTMSSNNRTWCDAARGNHVMGASRSFNTMWVGSSPVKISALAVVSYH